jgi:hypothetical protein
LAVGVSTVRATSALLAALLTTLALLPLLTILALLTTLALLALLALLTILALLSLLTILALLPLLSLLTILALLSLLTILALLSLLTILALLSLLAGFLSTISESTCERFGTPSEIPCPFERFSAVVFLDVTDRFTRSREFLGQLFDDPRGLGLELLGVLTILDPDQASGIPNSFLEFIVLDRPPGLVQTVRRLSLVGSGVTIESVELPLQLGDLFVHGLLALEEASAGL